MTDKQKYIESLTSDSQKITAETAFKAIEKTEKQTGLDAAEFGENEIKAFLKSMRKARKKTLLIYIGTLRRYAAFVNGTNAYDKFTADKLEAACRTSYISRDEIDICLRTLDNVYSSYSLLAVYEGLLSRSIKAFANIMRDDILDGAIMVAGQRIPVSQELISCAYEAADTHYIGRGGRSYHCNMMYKTIIKPRVNTANDIIGLTYTTVNRVLFRMREDCGFGTNVKNTDIAVSGFVREILLRSECKNASELKKLFTNENFAKNYADILFKYNIKAPEPKHGGDIYYRYKSFFNQALELGL